MSNVTAENCKKIIKNRFELCLIASKRAKEILSGAPTNHDRSVKSPIIALDEISDGDLDIDRIKKNIAAGDNIYQSEIVEDDAGEGVEKELDDKTNIFVNENLDVVD
ncbi:DNA-directed RNA polymerase subunit omega [Rickettsiales bacterium]|nr:DNA-directed RNA polymerase subunit omega [Rickettsiales bacterium]